MLQVSPGSTILLRGHVDNAMVEEFRKQGGEAFVRTQALKAMELSKQRAAEIRQMLITRLIGRRRHASRWSAAAGRNRSRRPPDENRRVEVQWFTIE